MLSGNRSLLAILHSSYLVRLLGEVNVEVRTVTRKPTDRFSFLSVSLTQTKKKGLEGKQRLVEDVRECAAKYSHIYLFSVQNMRNNKLKSIRSEWKDSRWVLSRLWSDFRMLQPVRGNFRQPPSVTGPVPILSGRSKLSGDTTGKSVSLKVNDI